MTPEPERGALDADDGVRLATWTWDPPEGAPAGRPTVLLAHGYAEHAGRYARLARALGAAGYPLAALDHRGHGASGGRRADIEDFGRYVADFGRFAEAAQPDPARRVVLGHSMGGAVAALWAAEHPGGLDALVLSSPYLRNAVPTPPLLERVARLLARVLPQLPVQRLDTATLSRLPDEVRAYETDPLVYTGAAKARMAVALVDAGPAVMALANAIRVPTLILHGEADAVAHPAGSRALADLLGARAELRLYAGGYHELFNDEERERVTADLLAWLERRYG